MKKPWFRTDSFSQERLLDAVKYRRMVPWNRKRGKNPIARDTTVELYHAYGHKCHHFQAEVEAVCELHPRMNHKAQDEDIYVLRNVRIVKAFAANA